VAFIGRKLIKVGRENNKNCGADECKQTLAKNTGRSANLVLMVFHGSLVKRRQTANPT